jgi:mRNA-degrading endonuclease YafQ of YafQ-DinJ toxin-antitoxin module
MNISSSRNFDKQFRKLPEKVQNQFSKRLQLFLKDSGNLQLNLHKLSGKYDELWSINITGDVRAVFDRSFQNTILFVAIGPHSELYK